MKYVSIDIETTGLDPQRNQIIEVGAVLDDLGNKTPIKDLQIFRAVIVHKEINMNLYCADLHRNLWQEMHAASELMAKEGKRQILGKFSTVTGFIILQKNCSIDNTFSFDSPWTHYVTPERFEDSFFWWLYKRLKIKDTISKSLIQINVAGKNVGTFDIPFLQALPGWVGRIRFLRRVIDPAILCVKASDEQLPNLQECLKRCKIQETVNHAAVNDALAVVKILRNKYK